MKPTKRFGAKPAVLVGDFRLAKFADDGAIVVNTDQCPTDLAGLTLERISAKFDEADGRSPSGF